MWYANSSGLPVADGLQASSQPRLGDTSDGHEAIGIPPSPSPQTASGTLSLPAQGRKRDRGEADPESSNRLGKSRRTTPNPSHGAQSGPPETAESNEVIDLTGDDVDLDSSLIAQQIRQAQQRAQEERDRLVALRLDREQSSPAPTPATAPAPAPAPPSMLAAQGDALSRLMDTQRANANALSAPSAPPAQFQSLSRPPVQSLSRPPVQSLSRPPVQSSMPGGWTSPFSENPFSAVPYMPFTTVPQPPMQVPQSQQYSRGRQPFMDTARASSVQSAQFHGSRNPYASPAHNTMPTPSWLSHAPGPPIFGSSDLSRIINKTSTFDLSKGQDPFGNPLDNRLQNFLNDREEPAMTEKELDDLLQNIRPELDLVKLKREKGPDGLKYPLYRHQSVALTWMKEMEQGTNKGGILADDMGLGKTISLLSLMLANPATSRPKTNLIIGPLSLIRQWEEEIKTKIKHPFRPSVYVHHGRKSSTDELMKFDVVLTTYGTIAQELKRFEKLMEDNQGRHLNLDDKASKMKFPLLHPQAIFHRVILDEAQCIKNRLTQTAKACHRLKSTYRWCLTGTPMMNGVLELFSLLQFLHIKPYNSWENFRKAFGLLCGMKGDPKSVAMSRLRALLKAIMLRRKKDSMMDGEPIIRLPAKTERIVYAELSADERDFYKQLEEKAQVLFNKYLRDGTVGKNYSHILVLLLRLRQACCHPHLNLDVNDAATTALGCGTAEGLEKLVRDLDPGIVDRITGQESFECPICYDAVPSPLFFIPCGHDSCKDCLVRLADGAVTQNIHEGNESGSRAKCPVCRSHFDPQKCFTYDIFKSIHMPDAVAKIEPDLEEDEDEEPDSDDESASSDEEDDEGHDDDDAEDVDERGNLKDFVIDDEAGVEEDESDVELVDLEELKVTTAPEQMQKESPSSRAKKKKKKKRRKRGKGREKERMPEVKASMLKGLRREAAKSHAAYKKYMRYLRETWMPAAKVSECMALLRRFEEEQTAEGGGKTIIFSQWTLLLDLIQVSMRHEEFTHKPLRYDGSMSADMRAQSAKDFRDDARRKVMLVSLRAGNAGLNLTSANRVIIMDPFWNPYIEMQAIDRAYRIGQMREVQVYRILTRKTVEDRIMDLQERKKAIVEAALDEKESLKIGRLNVNELRHLFNAR